MAAAAAAAAAAIADEAARSEQMPHATNIGAAAAAPAAAYAQVGGAYAAPLAAPATVWSAPPLPPTPAGHQPLTPAPALCCDSTNEKVDIATVNFILLITSHPIHASTSGAVAKSTRLGSPSAAADA